MFWVTNWLTNVINISKKFFVYESGFFLRIVIEFNQINIKFINLSILSFFFFNTNDIRKLITFKAILVCDWVASLHIINSYIWWIFSKTWWPNFFWAIFKYRWLIRSKTFCKWNLSFSIRNFEWLIVFLTLISIVIKTVFRFFLFQYIFNQVEIFKFQSFLLLILYFLNDAFNQIFIYQLFV